MTAYFQPMPTERARALQNGATDNYGQIPLRKVSDGDSMPCRHCLRNIEAGAEYMIAAYRPFSSLNPFAETGPIFLHARECPAAAVDVALPEILDSPSYIVRGYSAEEQIVYGTGAVTETSNITDYAERLLQDPRVAFVDVRSARNNCFQCRIMPA